MSSAVVGGSCRFLALMALVIKPSSPSASLVSCSRAFHKDAFKK